MGGVPVAVPTHCPYCSLQCGIELSPASDQDRGRIPLRLASQTDFPTNRGGLCAKGWTAAELLADPERLLTPLVRSEAGNRRSPLRPATWEEALGYVADRILTLQAESGRDSIGCFGGGGLTNEKAYAFGKFARVALRTSAIDYNGRFCMSSAASAGNKAFGIDRGLPFPLTDLAGADLVVLVGSNPADTMPPAMQHLDPAKFVVIDPRRTATAANAALHLAPRPGTDLALANGLLHLAIREDLVDLEYIRTRTSGFEAVRARVASAWPDRVESITGVATADLRSLIHQLARAGSAIVLTARGAEQHRNGTDTAQAWINLALALGLPGRPFSGYGTITGQGNGQGGREHGQKADQLPGYRRLDDPAARAHVAGVWGIDPDELPQPGLSAFEMLDRIGRPGGVRALLVLASNIVVSAPDANRIADRLAALDLLVVSDIFLSETAALADVVLPTTQWAEEEGTMTNLEGRVLRRRQAIEPPGQARSDLRILADLATALGRGRYFSADPRTMYDELRRASAGGIADYAGITWERIEAEQGVFWPCPTLAHPGTPRLFTDGFPTPDGRARFIPVDHRPPAENPDRDFPYVLTTGRTSTQYQSGSQTRRIGALDGAGPVAQLHRDLARSNGIAQDDMVRLRTRRGSATFRAVLDDSIRPDTVFVPFHYGGASTANALTDPALDPSSRMPAFKACAVAVERAGGPDDVHLMTTRPAALPQRPVVLPTPPAPTGSATRRTTVRQPSHRKDRAMSSKNHFLQGVRDFVGHGLDKPEPLGPEFRFEVPDGSVAQVLYFRGGNSGAELIAVVLLRDGVPMRYFPIGARSDTHVPLRVLEDIDGGAALELQVAAPIGATGSVVVDFGLVEV
ncbi:molybdopterin oxidoreductase family protein [Nakamurella endophytica]